MNSIFIAVFTLLSSLTALAQSPHADGNYLQNPAESFYSKANNINSAEIETLITHDRGRLKPLHTLARESILYITGGYKFLKLDPIQSYLGLIVFRDSQRLEIINIRDTQVREKLGFPKDKRFYSVAQLQKSPIIEFVNPLIEKEKRNKRTIEPDEKAMLEAYSQMRFTQYISSGSHLFESISFSSLLENNNGHSSEATHPKAKAYLDALASGEPGLASKSSTELIQAAEGSPFPNLFTPQKDKMKTEVLYNKSKLFFIAGILLLLLGIVLIFDKTKNRISPKIGAALISVPLIIIAIGFGMRVYITGFAPVTNMYGTMIWVALGIVLFSSLLFYLYKNNVLVGSLLIGSAFTLLLTENLPIVLSPDLDPIVAVLRSNLWLTIHVLTIVISYAALTITMIIGNIALVRSIIKPNDNKEFFKESAKSVYRMIQLGVFLLSVGIILGGIWADYSWGRFWGWDPKETWALIADLGYIAILHARHIGWLGPFGVLAASTAAYMLVIMAWYGVNFILAAGLHSYGFSSGGATLVGTFLIIQIALLTTALGLRYYRSKGA